MATSPRTEVAGESEEGLMQVLEQTIHARVLKDLEDPLADLIHRTVRSGIIAAAGGTSRTTRRATSTKARAVSRPAAGGRCAKVWDELDKLAAKGKDPTLQDVQQLAERKKMNPNTSRIQFYRWRSQKGTQPAA